MLLKTGFGIEISDADNESIASTLKNLSEREDDGESFAVLEASPDINNYMQTIVDGNNTFHVEYREQKEKKQYAADNVPLALTISLFQAYRNGDFSWKQTIVWDDISQNMEW